MLDAYIIERMRTERERARKRDVRVPLSIEPPPQQDPADIGREREDEQERPKRGVIVIDYTL